MKRELIQNVEVQPYTSGDIIDRTGYLSAIIGATVAAGGTVTVTATHCDTEDGTFEAVDDKLVFPEKATEGGVYSFTNEAEADGVVNIDVDLVGLKPFVKFTVDGATALAIALGDHYVQPV